MAHGLRGNRCDVAEDDQCWFAPHANQRQSSVVDSSVSKRRKQTGGVDGRLDMRGSREGKVMDDGRLSFRPADSDGVLLHDRNNRDVERLMQYMTENYGMYRVANDLLRARMGVIRTAISQRVG